MSSYPAFGLINKPLSHLIVTLSISFETIFSHIIFRLTKLLFHVACLIIPPSV